MEKKTKEKDYIKIKLSDIFMDNGNQLKKIIGNNCDKPKPKKQK